MSERKIKIGSVGPECPGCGAWGFDDLHHEPTFKAGSPPVAYSGSVRCHGCGKFFAFTCYGDGVTHSTMGFGRRALKAA